MKCKWCNNEVDPSKLSKYASGEFCSKICSYRYSQSTTNNGELKQGNCSVCGKEMWIKKRANSKQVKCNECKKTKLPTKPRVKKPDKYCLNCGNKMKQKNVRFCSNKCSYSYRKQQTFNKIEEVNGVGCDCRRLREYLIWKYGNKCMICGIEEWNGYPLSIIMDHIDGRSNNNHLDNLRLVCPNCDSQLPTYKSKNKNSDRKTRHRKKYT